MDILRGLVMALMALDHVRMYFALGTWYTEPTDLSFTTPALFFTRWITHFCAPVFIFLAGTSAYLYGKKKTSAKELSWFLFTRGLWLIFAEIIIVNFAWTFDITYSFIILQVIWATGISMLVLSALVFLPNNAILAIGFILVFGHNLLDSIQMQNQTIWDFLWYTLHQTKFLTLSSGRVINFVYPVLPLIGLMALGYVCGSLYNNNFPTEKRKRLLLTIGVASVLLFIILRGFNLYGEPITWTSQDSQIFTLISFLNTTKYPASLQFLLMTMGPALIFLSLTESAQNKVIAPLSTFGKVPFFFYIIHLYLIHGLATLYLVYSGRDWHEYIFSSVGIRSGALINFGLSLGAVYLVWIVILVLLYPICNWYQKYKADNPTKWWLSYL
jgi:uncharacterized membrane protein